MAFVMPLSSRTTEGMDRILNVSQKVGDSPTCVNNPADVEAVQRLIAIAVRQFAGEHGFGVPQPTGRFDPLTAYYIYHLQVRHRARNPAAIVDGDVSPARGESYGGGIWSIVNFNNVAFTHHQAEWEALLSRFPTRVS